MGKIENAGYPDTSEKRDLEARKNFSRFVFSLVGTGQSNVYVRTEKPVQYFPNGGDVIALGKKEKYGFEADVVFFGDNYGKMILADSLNFAIDAESNK